MPACLSVCLSVRQTITSISQSCLHQSKHGLLEMKAMSFGTTEYFLQVYIYKYSLI